MKQSVVMVVVLLLFCCASALLLAWTNAVTAAPIKAAKDAELREALRRVIPEYDNDIASSNEISIVRDSDVEWKFYVGRKNGQFSGAAVKSASRKGYNGNIAVLIGINAEGKLHGIEVLEVNETPGLGSRISEPKFMDQFKGRESASTGWCMVNKDGGEIQAITGATISSRAVSQAVKAGLDVYAAHSEEIRGKR